MSSADDVGATSASSSPRSSPPTATSHPRAATSPTASSACLRTRQSASREPARTSPRRHASSPMSTTLESAEAAALRTAQSSSTSAASRTSFASSLRPRGTHPLAQRSSRPSAPTARHLQSEDVNRCISCCSTASSPIWDETALSERRAARRTVQSLSGRSSKSASRTRASPLPRDMEPSASAAAVLTSTSSSRTPKRSPLLEISDLSTFSRSSFIGTSTQAEMARAAESRTR
mmetsp:Transcript_55341/g.131438  ORF Transcript_55341/g.131438 Transcript_55341/m.131438 type:complete len:233 (-) Transcript_55341:268-966(-)